jgi:tetratricopeptide (TPR) repeat protein
MYRSEDGALLHRLRSDLRDEYNEGHTVSKAEPSGGIKGPLTVDEVRQRPISAGVLWGLVTIVASIVVTTTGATWWLASWLNSERANSREAASAQSYTSSDVGTNKHAGTEQATDLSGAAVSPEFAASPDTSAALGALRADDIERAVVATKRLIDAFPTEPEAHRLRIRALLRAAYGYPGASPERKALEDALSDLETLDASDPLLQIVKAQTLQRDGYQSQAIHIMTELLSRRDLPSKTRATALRVRAQSYRVCAQKHLGCEGYPAALIDLKNAVALDPESEITFAVFAITLMYAGLPEQAIVRGAQAIALNPNSADAYNTIGDALSAQGRYQDSVQFYKRSAEIRADSQEYQSEYALALLKAGHRAEALRVAERASRLRDADFGVYNLARLRALIGDRDEALRLLNRYVTLGWADGQMFREEADFESVRDDPRFGRIVSETVIPGRKD